MNCPKCEKDFERSHPAQKYCDECRGVTEQCEIPVNMTINDKSEIVDVEIGKPKFTGPIEPLDVYSPERWSSLLENGYEFDPEIGRARCKEMSSNIALPSPGDPAYVETPAGEDMLTFNDLPVSDRFVIERESNPNEPERTREVMIETALSYHRLFGNAHAHEFGGK